MNMGVDVFQRKSSNTHLSRAFSTSGTLVLRIQKWAWRSPYTHGAFNRRSDILIPGNCDKCCDSAPGASGGPARSQAGQAEHLGHSWLETWKMKSVFAMRMRGRVMMLWIVWIKTGLRNTEMTGAARPGWYQRGDKGHFGLGLYIVGGTWILLHR